ncbi:MAG: DUF2844 domain-containing protein [Nitrospiria bacterium]
MWILDGFKFLVTTAGFCLALLLLNPGPALAVLGEGKESVELDRRKLSGSKETMVRSQYTIETISSSDLRIQEYVTPTGTIFAVSWQGKKIPDLSSLFGAYFQEYQKALTEWRKNSPFRRGPLYLRAEHLVVETGGNRRDLRGKAYLPSLLPPGIKGEDIQ